MAEAARPGQFVHIKCGEGLLLRRPISICDAGNGLLRIVFQVRGTGTQWLADQESGAVLDVLGPLGNGFQLPPSGRGAAGRRRNRHGSAALYGKIRAGGCGSCLGFRTGAGAILLEDFAAAGVPVEVATDDGTLGTAGTVDQVVCRCLRGKSLRGSSGLRADSPCCGRFPGRQQGRGPHVRCPWRNGWPAELAPVSPAPVK